MRAVVIATGYRSKHLLLNEHLPVSLLPLVDRPFVQHVVEYLVDRGVTEFDFALCFQPEAVESLLGDGTRWGSRFRFHLVRDADRPYGVVGRVAGANPGESVLLVHADRLPRLASSEWQPTSEKTVVFCQDGGRSDRVPDAHAWTGWARLSGPSAAQIHDRMTERSLASFLLAQSEARITAVDQCLSAQSYKSMLLSQQQVFDNVFPDLLLSGREQSEGIRMGRNVSLHPTARLVPPVYIAENCRIGENVVLGPNVSVGHDCILDAHTTVARAAIFPKSYVGGGLELTDVVVDRNRLVNLQLGTAVSIPDAFILGNIAEQSVRQGICGLFSQAVACLLLGLTWPLLLITALVLKVVRKGPVFYAKDVLRLPSPGSRSAWRTFVLRRFSPKEASDEAGLRHVLFHILPALVNIARGDLRFVGVPPRAPAEIAALSRDWQELYLNTKAGLITEAYVHYGPGARSDEHYSAEAFYAATARFQRDLKLVFGYFRRIGRSLLSRDAARSRTQIEGVLSHGNS